jgi:hypothetical protein
MLLFDVLGEFDEALEWQSSDDDPLLEVDPVRTWPAAAPDS